MPSLTDFRKSLESRGVDIEKARELHDARQIDAIHGDAITPDADQLEAEERAYQMTAIQLFDWFDDIDLILAAMPAFARAEHYKAHRALVAAAIVRTEQRV